MFEPPYIIQGNIERYLELLKFNRISDLQRRTVIVLLAEARGQLPLAVAHEEERGLQEGRACQLV